MKNIIPAMLCVFLLSLAANAHEGHLRMAWWQYKAAREYNPANYNPEDENITFNMDYAAKNIERKLNYLKNYFIRSQEDLADYDLAFAHYSEHVAGLDISSDDRSNIMTTTSMLQQSKKNTTARGKKILLTAVDLSGIAIAVDATFNGGKLVYCLIHDAKCIAFGTESEEKKELLSACKEGAEVCAQQSDFVEIENFDSFSPPLQAIIYKNMMILSCALNVISIEADLAGEEGAPKILQQVNRALDMKELDYSSRKALKTRKAQVRYIYMEEDE